MISICIPLYNHPNYHLIEQLLGQLNVVDESCELVIIDDASANEKRLDFRKLDEKVNFIQLEENVGRARIRNLFLKHAKQPYLLFIDGDSSLIHNDFLARYLSYLKENQAEVVCGRSIYPDKTPPKERRLRWLYGKEIEAQSVEERNKQPYQAFMTNNFIIKKSLMQEIPFDERLKTYGHEDTLMGFKLMKRGASIAHLDNAVLNAETESNELYLQKTYAALQNLIKIEYWLKDEAFQEHIKLLRFYYKMRSLGLILIIRILFSLLRGQIFKSIVKGNNSLFLFTFWKFGVFANLKATTELQAE